MNKLSALRGFNQTLGLIAPHWSARIAERIFWRPRRLPMRQWEQAIADQGERITTRFGLSALRWGQPGPTVLMLHGWEGRPTQFAHLIGPLVAAGYQVIGLDGPAHGRSPGVEADPVAFAEALLEVAAELPPLQAVIGHSMGAAATAIALSRGLRARRAVLIAAPSSLVGVLQRGAQSLGMSENALAQLHRLAERRTGVHPEALDIGRIGAQLKIPALIVHDREDDMIPVEESLAIARAWPNARLLQTRGLGHWKVLRDASVVREACEFVLGRALRPQERAASTKASVNTESQVPRSVERKPGKPQQTIQSALSHYG